MFKSRKLPNQIWSRRRCRCHISWVPSSASWGLPQVVHHLHSKIPWFAISCVPCHALLHSLDLLRSPCAPRVELLTGWQQACAGKKRLALHFRLRITRCREINEFCETNFFWLSSLTSAINSSNQDHKLPFDLPFPIASPLKLHKNLMFHPQILPLYQLMHPCPPSASHDLQLKESSKRVNFFAVSGIPETDSGLCQTARFGWA